MRGTSLLVALLLGFSSPAQAAAPHPIPGAPGLGDRLFPLLGNGGYDVLDYDLSLTYLKKDPKQRVRGDVTITAVATQSLSRFDLDFSGDGAGTVTVNGSPATSARSGEELVVTPGSPLAAHRRFTVRVAGFTATPVEPNADSPAGFVTTPDGTVLAGQPASAHALFPSNDHPSDLATYTITLTAPADWTATAGGTLTGTGRHGDLRWSAYRQSQPMAAELVQLAVGDFLTYQRPAAGGVPIRDVVPRRLAATLLPKAADEGKQVAWMQSKVGRYPFDRYGSLVIDGTLGFALETQTLSLYDTSLFGLPPDYVNPVLTHELAHQWFGDSVTPATWSDVWQNEGHATWYEILYEAENGTLQQNQGVDTLDEYYQRAYGRADEYRSLYGPVARPLKSGSIWDVFNPNVYEGGALALYALRQQIGTAAFQRLERAWVSRNRGRSVSTSDFITLAAEVSGQDLTTFMTHWWYGTSTPPMPGHPGWKVAAS